MTDQTNIPEDEEDFNVKDPITEKEIHIEGEHFTINRQMEQQEKEQFVDGDGNVLSDRVIAELALKYAPYPETLNGKEKGEFTTWEDNTGLTCELQKYGDEEIRVSYNTKLYGQTIKRLREIQTK